MDVAVVVPVRIGHRRAHPEARGPADDPLVGLPKLRGPHECLVVETGRQNGGEEAGDGAEIEIDGRPAVLAGGGQTVEQLDLRRPLIGIGPRAGAELDQGVGLVGAVADDAARAMVLEAAPDHSDAVGKKRGGQRIAGVGAEATAVEDERQRLCAIDQATARVAKSLPGHGRSLGGASPAPSDPRNAWLTVSRNATNHRRHPCA